MRAEIAKVTDTQTLIVQALKSFHCRVQKKESVLEK
jgi:hypothetical protein